MSPGSGIRGQAETNLKLDPTRSLNKLREFLDSPDHEYSRQNFFFNEAQGYALSLGRYNTAITENCS